jgi:hypothetical protein
MHTSPLLGGHSMVNIHFCSTVIKRDSVSSKMLEVPYGESNIIISCSSFCTHGLAASQTSRALLTITKPRKKQLGTQNRNVFPEV